MTEHGSKRTWAPLGLIATALVGMGFATYLVQHKLRIIFDPDYKSACNLSDAVNCDRVNMSPWSELFGVPVALFAIPVYVVLGWMALSALRLRASGKAEDQAAAQASLGYSYAASLVALTATVVLGAYSGLVLKTWCLFCVGLYGVSLAAVTFSLLALRQCPGKAFLGFVAGLKGLRPPFAEALSVAIFALVIALMGYTGLRLKLATEGLSQTQAQMNAALEEPLEFHYGEAAAPVPNPTLAPAAVEAAPVPAPAAPVAMPTAPAAPQVAPTTAAAAPVASPAPTPLPAPAGAPPVGVPGGKRTENGYSFYLTPLDSDDWFYGNPDATVTVVKYADFECAFCQYFAQQAKPVMEKYKDRVRFVMKQYPMNPQCNPYMQGYDKHPNACHASLAAICAGRQGKFWEMHEKLYAVAPNLDPAANRRAAGELGLDLAAFDACLTDPATKTRIDRDIEIAKRAAIYGTPRTFVNGRLLTGANSAEALEYYIVKALENAPGFYSLQQAQAAPTEAPAQGTMVEARRSGGAFFIDSHEASVTTDGRALVLPGKVPAMVSFDEANSACQKAGKRLCTEEEWVSACTGQPALDDNTNGWFNDDTIEGNMYAYGPFYEVGHCHDEGEKSKAEPVATGSKPACRTATGVFDLTGNINEWVSTTSGKPSLMGGGASAGSGATCNRRTATFGSGYRNQTTGFRCCADQLVAQEAPEQDQLAAARKPEVGSPVPLFKAADSKGAQVDLAAFKGKVLVVNFFASWCGPCKKEFPVLVELHKDFGAKGLEIVSVGVDGMAQQSIDFAAQFQPTFAIVPDPESLLMGTYNVYSMPATFIVDREGIIRFKGDEFSPEVHLEKLKTTVRELVGG